MSNPEQPQFQSELPSGYLKTEAIRQPFVLTEADMPWLKEDTAFGLTKCTLQSGKEFLLGSALRTHKDLVSAAEAMTEQQQSNCNNMFYSRVAGMVDGNMNAQNTDSFPNPATTFPIRVLRNKGGQRVYFGMLRDQATDMPIVLRLAACDKNKQAQVTRVLNEQSAGYHRDRTTK
jgi:hypothetical protein